MSALTINTEHLVLRPLAPDDAQSVYEYRSHADIARYQSWEPANVSEVRALIARQNGIRPNTPGTWYQLAICLKQTLELARGHAAATQLLATLTGDASPVSNAEDRARKDPTPDNLLQLSMEYYMAGRYEDCIRASREALELDPGFAPAYNNICSAYNARKMWDEGIAACDLALELAPDHRLARNNREWAVREKSRLEAAQTE